MNSQGTPGTDYTVITELPGDQITGEGMQMLHTRYAFARELCAGKDVLELACGPALGLKYLSRNARLAVGGDCNLKLLQSAGGGLPLFCLDAHTLPFADDSFDVILLCEAIYYLKEPVGFLAECRKVLRPGGTLLVSLPNREWPGFNPSPFSTRYFSVPELFTLFGEQQFALEVFGGFPSAPATASQKLRSAVRRFAVNHRLIPTTFKAKARLKRLFYGSLQRIENDLKDDEVKMQPLARLAPDSSSSQYRMLYALGRTLAPKPERLQTPALEMQQA